MEQHRFGSTQREVAAIGQGTWYIDNGDRASAIAALRQGLDLGMTHIDTAEMYGGAEEVVAYVTHGVLSGGAVARVEGSRLTELVITDSIGNHESIGAARRIRHLPIAPLLGEAIKRIADETSVSSLFD